MAWLLVVVVIIVIGLAVMAGSGKFGQVPPIVDDRPAPDLPEGDLSAEPALSSLRSGATGLLNESGGSAPRPSGFPDGDRPRTRSHEYG